MLITTLRGRGCPPICTLVKHLITRAEYLPACFYFANETPPFARAATSIPPRRSGLDGSASLPVEDTSDVEGGRIPAALMNLVEGKKRAVSQDVRPPGYRKGRDCARRVHNRSRNDGRGTFRGKRSTSVQFRRDEAEEEDDGPPRFQPFGRPGGGGEIAAAAVYQQFGHEVNSDKNGHIRKRFTDWGDEESHEDWETRAALIEWLVKKVAVSEGTAASMLERESRIKVQSAEEMGVVVRWFRDSLGLSEEGTRTMLVRKPGLLCKGLKEKLKPKVQWLKDELGLDDKEAGAVVTLAPNIVSSEVETMRSKMAWLSQRLGVTHAEMCKIVTSCPFVLANGITTALEPRLQWMHENLFRDEAKMRDHILLYPAMVGHSLYGTLVPTFRILKETLGIDVARVRAVLMRNPRMFTTHLGANMLEKKIWLRQELGVEAEDDVTSILHAEPHLLIRSNTRLNAHMRFFRCEMRASIDDVREAVLSEPRILLAGIENHWMPRVQALVEAGIKVDFRSQWHGVFKYDDREFRLRLKTFAAKAQTSELG